MDPKTTRPVAAQRFLAPAKLNLFLHVVGRRADGYHLLQSLFCLLNWADEIEIGLRQDGRLVRQGDLAWPVQTDLALRAAQALQAAAIDERVPGAEQLGASLLVHKHLPSGAGLGGGSSDAATVLMALNRLWGLNRPTPFLAEVGLQLGADVPFFLGGRAAFVEGVGEDLRPLEPNAQWFVVMVPAVEVPTASIFRDPALTHTPKALRISDLSEAVQASCWTFGHNDLQAVASRLHAQVAIALDHAKAAAVSVGLPSEAARMSGSGGAVFVSCVSGPQAEVVARQLQAAGPGQTSSETPQVRICQRLIRHPAL